MTVIEKELSILIETSLLDLETGLAIMGSKIDMLQSKAKLNGWDKKKTNAMVMVELESLRKSASKAVEAVSQGSGVLGSMTKKAGSDLDKKFIWQAVGNNVCPSCVDLHGTIKTFNEWLDYGLPGNAPTYCGVYCKCMLVEVEEAVDNPITLKREKGKRGGKGQIIAISEKTKKPITKENDDSKK